MVKEEWSRIIETIDACLVEAITYRRRAYEQDGMMQELSARSQRIFKAGKALERVMQEEIERLAETKPVRVKDWNIPLT